jgi:hypothetical protein
MLFAKQNFDWKEKLHAVCTDGAPELLCNTSAFVSLVQMELLTSSSLAVFQQTCTGKTNSSSNTERQF